MTWKWQKPYSTAVVPLASHWGRIERRSNWGYWDELNGNSLVTGETLEVEFPDKSHHTVTVTVNRTEQHVSDHGHDTTIGDSRAVWLTMVRGVQVAVPLVGLTARRVVT